MTKAVTSELSQYWAWAACYPEYRSENGSVVPKRVNFQLASSALLRIFQEHNFQYLGWLTENLGTATKRVRVPWGVELGMTDTSAGLFNITFGDPLKHGTSRGSLVPYKSQVPRVEMGISTNQCSWVQTISVFLHRPVELSLEKAEADTVVFAGYVDLNQPTAPRPSDTELLYVGDDIYIVPRKLADYIMMQPGLSSPEITSTNTEIMWCRNELYYVPRQMADFIVFQGERESA